MVRILNPSPIPEAEMLNKESRHRLYLIINGALKYIQSSPPKYLCDWMIKGIIEKECKTNDPIYPIAVKQLGSYFGVVM